MYYIYIIFQGEKKILVADTVGINLLQHGKYISYYADRNQSYLLLQIYKEMILVEGVVMSLVLHLGNCTTLQCVNLAGLTPATVRVCELISDYYFAISVSHLTL